MAIAQLDLTNWSARGVNLPKNYRRAVPGASRRPAGTRIIASPDLNGRRRGIEVRLKHRDERTPAGQSTGTVTRKPFSPLGSAQA